MEIADILAKAAAGVALNDGERAALGDFKLPQPDDAARREQELASLRKERDEARSELQSHLRRNKVGELASAHRFGDADYLDYLMARREIDLEDPAKVELFFEELKTCSPKLFRVELTPGSGEPPPRRAGTSAGGGRDLASMLAEAPEITR